MRVVLPIQLEGDHLIAFGTWIEVNRQTVEEASKIWETQEYDTYTCQGTLANTIPPWETLPKNITVRATTKIPTESPYIIEADNKTLQKILDNKWPHHQILNSLPS